MGRARRAAARDEIRFGGGTPGTLAASGWKTHRWPRATVRRNGSEILTGVVTWSSVTERHLTIRPRPFFGDIGMDWKKEVERLLVDFERLDSQGRFDPYYRKDDEVHGLLAKANTLLEHFEKFVFIPPSSRNHPIVRATMLDPIEALRRTRAAAREKLFGELHRAFERSRAEEAATRAAQSRSAKTRASAPPRDESDGGASDECRPWMLDDGDD